MSSGGLDGPRGRVLAVIPMAVAFPVLIFVPVLSLACVATSWLLVGVDRQRSATTVRAFGWLSVVWVLVALLFLAGLPGR